MGGQHPLGGPKINLWGCNISDKKRKNKRDFVEDFCEIMDVFTPSGLREFQIVLFKGFSDSNYDKVSQAKKNIPKVNSRWRNKLTAGADKVLAETLTHHQSDMLLSSLPLYIF